MPIAVPMNRLAQFYFAGLLPRFRLKRQNTLGGVVLATITPALPLSIRFSFIMTFIILPLANFRQKIPCLHLARVL